MIDSGYTEPTNDNYVSYDSQTPSENEKEQARQNIGAMGLNSFDLYMNGAVPRPPVPPFFTQRIPNIVPGYTEFELINGLNRSLLIEQTARQNTDLLLKENLEKETADRIQADNQLQQNITAEETERKNADTILQQNINSEADEREEADTQLEGEIAGLQADLVTEKTNRENADNTLQQAITDETTARQEDTETVMAEIEGIKGREYKVVHVTVNEQDEYISSMSGQEIYNLLLNDNQILLDIMVGNELIYRLNPSIYIDEHKTILIFSCALTDVTDYSVVMFSLPIKDTYRFLTTQDCNLTNIANNVTTLQTDVTTLQTDVTTLQRDVNSNFVSATKNQNFTEDQKAIARANIGVSSGGTTDGAVLYDQAQSLTDEQKLQGRKNIDSVGAVVYANGTDKTSERPIRFYNDTTIPTSNEVTIGGFAFTVSEGSQNKLTLQQNINGSWENMFRVPYLTADYNINLNSSLLLTITGEPSFTYPIANATLIATVTGANAGYAVKRFFSGTLSITEAANVTIACDVLEMYFLPFKTSDVPGNSGTLNYKIVLKVTNATTGASHSKGDVVTLYNELWDNNYVSVSGSLEA